MTQEEKLLLIDLSPRVHYGVLVEQTFFPTYLADKVQRLKSVQNDNVVTLCWRFSNEFVPICDIKPYLRPMSSMTEEEKKILNDITYKEYDGYTIKDTPAYTGNRYVYYDEIDDLIDFYNSHHFDFRGLIEKGLALEAPEGMYN